MPVRPSIILAIAAALLAAISLLAPARTDADQPATDSVALAPGLNVVGWLSHPKPVSELFDQIPQLESIWSWDPWDQRWLGANRALPPSLRQIDEVRPGSAALFLLNGEAPAAMERPLQLVAGTVPLARGRNIVAWLGRDDVPLDHALRGIGRSLDSAQLWDPESQSWIDPAGGATLEHGAPIAVTVDWPVDWLQPTYAMPDIKTPGRPADQLEIHRRHVAAVLEFFDKQWAVQADPFRFDIYIPRTFNDLRRQYYEDGLIHDPDALLPGDWQRFTDGWSYAVGDYYVLVPAHVPRASLAFGVHVHEYAHILQYQLEAWDALWIDSANETHPGHFPDWIIEGSAEFAQVAAWRNLESVDDWWSGRSQRVAKSLTWRAPQLQDVQRSARGNWEYDLGLLAFEQLAEIAGPIAVFDLFRARKPRPAGPGFRWLGTPNLEQAFAASSGLELDDFHRQFARWQCDRIEENIGEPPRWCREAEPQDDIPQTTQPMLRGIASTPGAAPIQFAKIIACGQSSPQCDPPTEAWTAADGSFALPLAPGRYQLRIDLGDDCPSSWQVQDGEGAPAAYDIGPDGLENIRITVPLDACGPRIEGRIRINSDEIWRPVQISASSDARAVLDRRSGRFWVTAPAAGRYDIDVWLDPAGPSECEAGDGETIPRSRERTRQTFDVPPQGLANAEITFTPPPPCNPA